MGPFLLIGAALACVALSFGLGRTGRRTAGGGDDGARGVGKATGGSAPEPTVAPPAPGPGLVSVLARHRWARYCLGGVSVVLVLAAVGVAAYPLITDEYTETLQTRLEKQFVSGETRTAYETDTVAVGDSLTRLRIPAIGLDTIVVEGATDSALRAGAGHFPETPLPCEVGNVSIAGHRTTYGKPFADLEKLGVGDEVFLDTPIGGCTYEVTEAPFEVQPKDVWVIEPSTEPLLTLTTCHPEGSARQRLVLRAKRVSHHQETN